MDVLGAARFDLVGHDWGGQISWLIAAGRRERLRSLTVLSRPHPGAFARAMIEDSAQAARSGHHRAFRTGDAVARMRAAELAPLRQALLDQGVPPPNAEVYITTLLQPGGIEGAMAWYRASGIAAATTPSISTPTLYVWGEDDATVGRRAAELTAEHVSGPYSFVALPGVGHFVVDERPRSVSQLIIDHIASATPGD
jgi:pimeloyl-ACP methyl ester carboxylesterase